MTSCPTCGREPEHAPWCNEVRRQHHDDDVRDGLGHRDTYEVRDFDRWGWEVIDG